MQSRKTSHAILVLCILTFIFNLHYALLAYLISSYIGGFIGSANVGIAYTAGSLATILCFAFIAPLLSRLGNFRLALVMLFIEFASLLGLAYAPTALLVYIAFIASFVSTGLMWFTFDIFLEHFSTDKLTGNIRGIYLTIGNMAWVMGPVTASFILGDGGFNKLFLVSAALLIPVIFLLKHNFSGFKDPEYRKTFFFESFKEMWRDKNVRDVFIANFFLQFFYAWMVIYTPIYLHETIGLPWTTIGIIISFVLIPFVILDTPLGILADRKLGEKEILSAGFLIMAIFTALIFLLDTKNPVIWGAVLFMTRVGAASVEIMCDTYFFKKVNSTRVNIISVFRTTRPIAYIIAPLVATYLLFFVEMKSLFLILGFMMFFGLRYGLGIKDTR